MLLEHTSFVKWDKDWIVKFKCMALTGPEDYIESPELPVLYSPDTASTITLEEEELKSVCDQRACDICQKCTRAPLATTSPSHALLGPWMSSTTTQRTYKRLVV